MVIFNAISRNVERLFSTIHPVVLTTFVLIIGFSHAESQEKILTIDHPPIDEQSSIVKSKTYKNVYWLSNDSGDDPVIFPVDEKGKIIVPKFLKRQFEKKPYPGITLLEASNHDWESMALLGDTLVIGDVGNNANVRRDLGIYLVPEPNPHEVYQMRPLYWYPVHYPEQRKYPPNDWNFDCESIFTFQGKIYMLTKHRADQNINKPHPSTNLYRLDTRSTTKSNALVKVGSRDNLGGWVTDADIAPDESGLVFIALNPLAATIWYFPRPKKGDDFLSEKPLHFNLVKADQAEGVCFKDNKTIIVTNEQRDWFEIPLSKFSK